MAFDPVTYVLAKSGAKIYTDAAVEIINNALAKKADLENGKVPLGQLPSFVIADVVEVPTYDDLPETGQSGVVYYVSDTAKSYRWVGSSYVEINNKANYYSVVVDTDTNTMGDLKTLVANINIAGEHVFFDLHDYIEEGYICTVHFFTDSNNIERCEINDILSDRMYGVGQTFTSEETIVAYLAKTDARYDIKHVETADGQVLTNDRGSITLPPFVKNPTLATTALTSFALDAVNSISNETKVTVAVSTLTITDLLNTKNLDLPTWSVNFKTASSGSITITLPTGVKFATGEPIYDNDTEYLITIRKGYSSGEYIAVVMEI